MPAGAHGSLLEPVGASGNQRTLLGMGLNFARNVVSKASYVAGDMDRRSPATIPDGPATVKRQPPDPYE
jgi:hypothetical protein